jgi:hypothetical protein
MVLAGQGQVLRFFPWKAPDNIIKHNLTGTLQYKFIIRFVYVVLVHVLRIRFIRISIPGSSSTEPEVLILIRIRLIINRTRLIFILIRTRLISHIHLGISVELLFSNLIITVSGKERHDEEPIESSRLAGFSLFLSNFSMAGLFDTDILEDIYT